MNVLPEELVDAENGKKYDEGYRIVYFYDDNNYEIYNNIKDFLYSFKKSSTLYFHNLKFDGSFILNFC